MSKIDPMSSSIDQQINHYISFNVSVFGHGVLREETVTIEVLAWSKDHAIGKFSLMLQDQLKEWEKHAK